MGNRGGSYRDRIVDADRYVKQLNKDRTTFEGEFRLLKGSEWTTLKARPSSSSTSRESSASAQAAVGTPAGGRTATGDPVDPTAGGGPVDPTAGGPPLARDGAAAGDPADSPNRAPLPDEHPSYYVARSTGDLPEGSARSSTVVHEGNVVAKLQGLEASLKAATAHAVVSRLRAPPQGETRVWRLHVYCACREASEVLNEFGQGPDGNGDRDSVSGRYTKCPFEIVLQTTTDFGEDRPPIPGAMKIVVARVNTQHRGHLERFAAHHHATTLTPVEAAAVAMIMGPGGGNEFTNYSALAYLNSASTRKTAPLTRKQLNNIKAQLDLQRTRVKDEDDVYELIASLMVAGAGFAIEVRGAGAIASTSMIVRELDNPNKLYFIKDPDTFEETLDEGLRNSDGPPLGEDCDRCVAQIAEFHVIWSMLSVARLSGGVFGWMVLVPQTSLVSAVVGDT